MDLFPIICSQNATLDLRPLQVYVISHLKGSASFPVDELAFRLFELPAKTELINLLGDEECIENAKTFLNSKGYQVALTQTISDGFLLYLNSHNYLKKGLVYERLWRPANIVKSFVENYASQSVNKNGLDLACGSGRDTVYMASKGWSMTGIDYLPSALDKSTSLANRCEQEISFIEMDIEDRSQDHPLYNHPNLNKLYGCIIVVRYLHRPILQSLKKMLDIGGYIVYQTFMQGCEKFGSPKNPRFLLKPDELADNFKDFEILVDEVEYLADGRPTNRFIARKVR